LIEYLQGGHVVVLATVDPNGVPDISLITWVLAMNDRTVRFVVSAHNTTARNLLQNGSVALQILGPKIAYAIKGKARLLKERIETTSFPESLFEMAVEEVYENRFGTTHVGGPIQILREDKVEEIAAQVGARVLAEMRVFKVSG
jgi:flavin reductase (DIM6/NTAB) family NADH-FMN oxidoreductase RutF